MLDIVPGCNLVQYQGKTMKQTSENSKRLNFGPNFDPTQKKFFRWVLPLLVVRYCSKLSCYPKRKLMNQTWESDEKPMFGPDFGPFGLNLGPKFFFLLVLPLLDAKHCRKLLLHAISRKTYDSHLMAKNLILGLI